MNPNTKTVLIACMNESGTPDMLAIKYEDSHFLDNRHLARSLKETALKQGKQEPFIFYFENDIPSILKNLSKQGNTIRFTMPDIFGGASNVDIEVQLSSEGVKIGFDGYESKDGDEVLYIENHHGEPSVMAYTNINLEDPTEYFGFQGSLKEHSLTAA